MDPMAMGANVPHLIQLIKDQFVNHCAAKGVDNPEDAPAQEFWEFAAEYLDKHRTVEHWPADRNLGVRLANNIRCLLHPATAVARGTMQQSGSVGVTTGGTQPGQEGVTAAGEKRVFMDTESFEQYELDEELLHDALPFLVEEETYRLLTVEGQIASIQMPPHVTLEVVDTAPVEHIGGSNVQKEAKLNSGIVIHVPLFIKNGDKIRVNCESRTYEGKEH